MSAIQLGSTSITKVLLGTTAINKAYLGANLLWDFTGGVIIDESIGNSVLYALTTADHVVGLTETTVPLDTEVQIDSDTFSTSSGVITVAESGTYMIINHMAGDMNQNSGNRTSLETFISINGSTVSGAYTDGYIRRTSNDEECSDSAFGIYDLNANDTVEMRALRINQNQLDGAVVGTTDVRMPFKTSLMLVKLNSNHPCCILEATSADNISLAPHDNLIECPFTTQLRIDDDFTHTSGQAGVTLNTAGRYLVMYSNSWERTENNNTRTGVYERLQLDGVDIPGSFDNNYLRGDQSSEAILRGNNSCAVIVETSTDNQVLRLVAAREDNFVDIERLSEKSRLCIYKLPDDAKSFSVRSATSTQSMALSSEPTMEYDTVVWADDIFTLASNRITVSSDAKMLLLNSMEADDENGSSRTAPIQYFAIDGTVNYYASGNGYIRATQGMGKATPTVGLITNMTNGQTVEVIGTSLAVLSSTTYRTVNSGGFTGLDLNSLKTAVAEPDPDPIVFWEDFEDNSSRMLSQDGSANVTVSSAAAYDNSSYGLHVDGSTSHTQVRDNTVSYSASSTFVYEGMVNPQTGGVNLVGLCFGNQDNGFDGYNVIVDTRNGSGSTAPFQLRTNNNYESITDNDDSPTINADTWYKIRVEWRDTEPRITCKLYLDDVQIGNIVSNSTAYTSGYCGVHAYNDAYFDNLYVEE